MKNTTTSNDNSNDNNEIEIIETSRFIKQQHIEEELKEDVLNKSEKSLSVQQSLSDGKKGGLRQDMRTIILLIYLYFMQGLPLGLAGSMPFILSSRKASFSDQGTYSFVFWPFSIKLLWAPLVDSLFIKRFGRRKTWLVPVQLIIGILMLSLASTAQDILYNIQSQREIILLTVIFISFTFLAATQDIAVDGWAINMLSKENVSWQSTCNGVGQTAGALIGGVVFIVLESVKFSNEYIRPMFGLPPQDYGILSLTLFMYIIGVIFLITSVALAIFKSENHDALDNFDEKLNLLYSYKLILKLFGLRPIQIIALVLLTVKIGFACESLNFLKLIEKGVSKEKLSLLQIPITPFNILWPLIISKWTNGPKPMNIFFNMIPIRLAFGLVAMAFIYYTPYFQDQITGEYPLYYFALCLSTSILSSMIETTMFMAQLSFNAKVSDEIIGGTYMTLLTTLGNLGGTYPSTIALFLVDLFSVKHCSHETAINFVSNSTTSFNQTVIDQIKSNDCSSKKLLKECERLGGKCITTVDAYYYLVIAFTVVGLIWILVFSRCLLILNNTPKSGWTLFKQNQNGSTKLK